MPVWQLDMTRCRSSSASLIMSCVRGYERMNLPEVLQLLVKNAPYRMFFFDAR
jgi:hypothetical protein